METAGDHLNALDATFLELEQADPGAHMHIGGVMIFEPYGDGGAPPIELIRAELHARTADLPRYRQRLSAPETGGLHWPQWVDDERFDIARHVFRQGLPEPRGEGELLEWAGDYYSRRLDRAHPLWEAAVLELADGRWAMASKTHHCLVDGVGSVEMVHTLLDARPDGPRRANGVRVPGPDTEPPHAPDRSPPLLAALRVGGGLLNGGVRASRSALRAAASVLRAGAHGVEASLHPKRAREALARSRALVELVVKDEVIPAPASSINVRIGTQRRLVVFPVPLDELKRIKQALGGSVNDVVLAATAGGLRTLFETRGEPPPAQGLRAMVPVNIRSAGDRLALGNRITSLFVHLPVAAELAGERYRLQVEEAEGMKSGRQGAGSSAMIDLAGHAPPVVHSFLARSLFASRLFNITITNVPGPQEPVYAFGSRMLEVWPIVPLAADHAVGLAVFSYHGRLFFCLNADRDSMPDLEVLADGISASLDELGELATATGSVFRPDPVGGFSPMPPGAAERRVVARSWTKEELEK
jgi:diacylglycerol O-acyltransferase / wax synthase